MPTSQVTTSSDNLVYSFCRLLWRDLGLRRVPYLRSLWAFIIRLWLILRKNPTQDRTYFNQVYARKVDPWNYQHEIQQERHRSALEFLDEIRQDEKIPRALEIGCSEGVFTQLLAESCESLLALDLSPVALDRAKER